MASVIEVRLVNDDTKEVLYDGMTQASSHEEALRLAFKHFSVGVGVMKSFEMIKEPVFLSLGANSCWQTVYSCTLEDDEYDREMLALVFSPYKEVARHVTVS